MLIYLYIEREQCCVWIVIAVEGSIGMKEHLPMSVRVVVEILVAKPFDRGRSETFTKLASDKTHC